MRWQNLSLRAYSKFFIYFFLLIISPYSLGDSPNELLQVKLQQIRSLSANFKQIITTDTDTRELSNSTGIMFLERPGHFRWQTKSPMEQVVVADGKHLWVYDVELEQVSVAPQAKNIGGSAALFLSGDNNNLKRDFAVSVTIKDSKQIYDLKATHSKANFQRIRLIFVGDILATMEMYDQLNQHTIVHFSDVKVNTNLDPKLFTFKPPAGTDVVEQ